MKPGEISYWQYVDWQGNKAHCLLGGYKTPMISLGKEQVEELKKVKTESNYCLPDMLLGAVHIS